MSRFVRVFVLVAVLAILSMPILGNASTSEKTVSATEKKANVTFEIDVARITIDWSCETNPVTYIPNKRINEGMSVEVMVQNFNFLRFDLQVDISTKTIVSYQVLSDLWKQLLIPGFSLMGVKEGRMTKQDLIADIERKLEQLGKVINGLTAKKNGLIARRRDFEKIKTILEKKERKETLSEEEKKVTANSKKSIAQLKEEIDKIDYEIINADKDIALIEDEIVNLKALKLKLENELRYANDFIEALKEWRNAMADADNSLKDFSRTQGLEQMCLTRDLVTAINNKMNEYFPGGDNQGSIIKALEDKRTDAWDKTLAYESATESYHAHLLYDRYLEAHEKLINKLREFARLADYCIHGKSFLIGQYKAGTLVDIILQPKASNASGTTREKCGIQYFVHSKFPVLFHVGLTGSFLEKLEFEKVWKVVEAGTSGDFYQLVEDGNTNFDFSAFLSWELYKSNDLRWGTSLTFGTDFKDPGDNLYFGVSGRFRKALLTFGAAWNKVVRGENKIGDVAAINLYETIIQERDWGYFFAVSFTLF